jgi:hypothetical protein
MISMTARTPDDILAAVPVVLGFHPSDSVVMVTFGGREAFHARIDLIGADQVEELMDEFAEALLAPALRQEAVAVLFVYYSSDAALVAQVHRDLSSRCRRAELAVMEGMRVAGGRWFPAWRVPGPDERGVSFDPVDHPFAAQAVMAGLVTAGSRAELAQRLATESEGARAVSAELERARQLGPGQARDVVEAHLGAATRPSDEEAASLLTSLADEEVREAIWWGVRRDRAARHVELWSDLVRRAPEDRLTDAASVLAALSWLAGHGALAWCAIDRGRERGGDNELLGLIAGLLSAGVPPIDDWSSPDTRSAR